MGMPWQGAQKQQNWWNLGSNHMDRNRPWYLWWSSFACTYSFRAGSEIGASGGGPEQDGREQDVLVAQPGEGAGVKQVAAAGPGYLALSDSDVLRLGAASDSSLAKAPPDGRVIGRGRWDEVETTFVLFSSVWTGPASSHSMGRSRGAWSRD